MLFKSLHQALLVFSIFMNDFNWFLVVLISCETLGLDTFDVGLKRD